jgi:hypothetical protein
MSITLCAATKLLDNMMINYSKWHTERAPQGKKVNSVEETSFLSDKIDTIMSMLVNGKAHVDPNHSFKNRTGDQTGEDVGSGFYWSNHWFTGSLSGFLIYKVIYILLYNVAKNK